MIVGVSKTRLKSKGSPNSMELNIRKDELWDMS
jgi:hypothetical protein